MTGDRTRWRTSTGILLVAAAAAVFAAGTFLVPASLRFLYAPVCHQLPERSFTHAGESFATCARCFGLYAGGVLGLVAAAWASSRGRLHPRVSWLVVAAVPTAIDVAAAWLAGGGLTNGPRCALAVPLGFTAALFLAVGLEDLLRDPLSAIPGFRR